MFKYQIFFLFICFSIISNLSYSAEDKLNTSNLNKNIHASESGNSTIVAGGDSAGGAVGGTGGTNSGGGAKTLKRSIASVVDNTEFENLKLNTAKKCLKRLNSSYIPKSISSSEDVASIKKEISLSVDKLKKEKVTIDSIHFPECVFYANETNDMPLKNLFYKFRIPSSESINDPGSSSIPR